MRELLGKRVRSVWRQWAAEQPSPKPSWLLPWEALSEPDREVDRRIGQELFEMGIQHAAARNIPVVQSQPADPDPAVESAT